MHQQTIKYFYKQFAFKKLNQIYQSNLEKQVTYNDQEIRALMYDHGRP